MKNLMLTFVVLVSCFAYSQDNLDNLSPSEYIESTEKKWEYFTLNETISATVIHHSPALAFCGTIATASMTIVKTQQGEIIRVLDLCNIYDNYKPDQKIKIKPENKPSFKVSLPFLFVENSKTKKVERKSEYDLKILKTTWGSFIE